MQSRRALSVLAALLTLGSGTLAVSQAEAEDAAPPTPALSDLYRRNIPSATALEEIPGSMLSVYRYAAADAECALPWTVLAGIAEVASDHGRVNGARVRPNGTVYPSIYGAPLDGQEGRHRIADTDGGAYDDDLEWDRALGPFQFIPTTWEAYAADGNGDRIKDPQNVWDAAASAAAHLCAYDAHEAANLDVAIGAYYQHLRFNDDVIEAAHSYTGDSLPPERLNQVDAISVLRTTDTGELERFDPLLNAAERIGVSGDGVAYGDWDGDGEANIATLSFADGSGLVSFGPQVTPDGGPTLSAPTSTTTTLPASEDDERNDQDQNDQGRGQGNGAKSGKTEAVRDDATAANAQASARAFTITNAVVTSLVVNFVADPQATLLAGDWNRDYDDELALYTTFDGNGRFTRVDDAGDPDQPVAFGQEHDQPLVGDWDGDAVAEFGVYRPATERRPGTFLKADSQGNLVGAPVRAGEAGSRAVVGDWDGDGRDSLALLTPDSDNGVSTVQRYDEKGEPTGEVLTIAGDDLIPMAGVFPPPVVDDPPNAEELEELDLTGALDDVSFFGTRNGPNGEQLDLWRVRGIIVDASMAQNLAQMLAAAEADGFIISGWGWRSNEQQIALRQQNCPDVYDSPPSACRPPTAIPGSSRHEYGRAVDFNVNGSVLRASSPEFLWMVENAADFGFINLPSEPWHWSDTGG